MHERSYHHAIASMLLANEAPATHCCEAGLHTCDLALWRFPQLRRLSYLHCGAGSVDDDDDNAQNPDAYARMIPVLLAHCGPRLAGVVLASCFTCTSAGTSSAPAGVACRAPYVLPAAALLDLGGRARLEELECSMVVHRCNMDSVCAATSRRFCALRKLHAFVQSRRAVRSLVAMLAGAAAGSDAGNDGSGKDGGESAAAATVLMELQLKLAHHDLGPFAHLLAPFGGHLRELCHVVVHPPGQAPVAAGADLVALGQLRELRELYIDATTSGGADAEEKAADDYDDDDGPHLAAHGTPVPPPPLLAPTDTDMLALVASLAHLESLHVELVESRFSDHIHADVGRCCPKLRRLRVPAPLDFDVLLRTGQPLFPAFEELSARNAVADQAFKTR